MYATKRRQRNFKRVREPPKVGTTTNPSKRHRERLNGELETVASLLPYDQSVLSRLDKLSVLRLAVSYLQAKTHFQVSLQKQYMQHPYYSGGYGSFMLTSLSHTPSSADKLYANEANIFKAIGGFVLILNENGDIYYASENMETYLGFHQSDILHQPVFDMIHSEDREELRQQLSWTYALPPTNTFQDIFTCDGLLYLERNASARFRCLLDNTCGFLRIDIRGKLTILQGLPHCYLATRSDPTLPVLGLLAVCTPFVPPPNLDGPDTEPFLKTKHALDFSLFSLDAKAKALLEVDEKSFPISFYSTVHHEDAPCLGEAHREAIKNGASGLLVYRVISKKTHKVYWLQSSCRLFYKNGKPESIGCTHRLLTEVEGETLLEKRASLSAKLLTFDDSLLQSPKLLQSTAALQATAISSQKTKSRKFRPPTVSTSFRDSVSRNPQSMSSLRATFAVNKGLFPVMDSIPTPYFSPASQNSLPLHDKIPFQAAAAQTWLNPNPKGSFPSAHYYNYLSPTPPDMYAPPPNSGGIGMTVGGSLLSNGTQGYPSPAAASDSGSYVSGKELQPHTHHPHNMSSASPSAKPLGAQTWVGASEGLTPVEWIDPNQPYVHPRTANTSIPSNDFTQLSYKSGLRSGGTESIIPNFNFSISEVTNTLLGQ